MQKKLDKGIIFYPMEANHTSNKKIRLLFIDHDSDGYWIWSNLVSAGYKQHGYYFKANTEDIELLASDCRKSPELIQEVILSCVKRGLFDKEIYEKHHVLTNDRMQINFLRANYDNRRKGYTTFLSEKYLAITPQDLGQYSDKFLENAAIKESGESLKNLAKKHTLFPEQSEIPTEVEENSTESNSNPTENSRFPLQKVKESKVKESKYYNKPAKAGSEINGHIGTKKSSNEQYGDGVKTVGGKRKKVAAKKEKAPEVLLFNEMKQTWMAWYVSLGNKPPKFAAKEAGILSHLRAYFLRLARDGDYPDVYSGAHEEFKFILDNWEKLKPDKFLFKCVDLPMMYSKINEIQNYINNATREPESREISKRGSSGSKPFSTSDSKIKALKNWGVKTS